MKLLIDKYRIGWLFILISFIPMASYSQFDKGLYNKMLTQWKNENIIQLKHWDRYVIKIVGDSLDIDLYSEDQFMVIKPIVGQPFEQNAYSSVYSELIDFEANGYYFENGKYVKRPVKSYLKKSNTDDMVFFDDTQEMVFPFQINTQGTIVELKTHHKIHEPRLLQSFFTQWMIPIIENELLIEIDPEINLEILPINNPELTDYLIEKNSKKSKILQYKNSNVAKVNSEDFEPGIRYYLPHLLPVIRSYQANGETVDILKDNHSLYRWYRTFIEQMDTTVSPELRLQVENLTKNGSSDLEKASAIFKYVQQNIKYIAFEYGLSGFRPDNPDLIFKKKFGDCKGNSSLLCTMLNMAGIEAYMTWIGTSDLPYTYEQVSSPSTDNHMIVTCFIDGETYFLDATGKYLLPDLPTSFIQGKEALVGLSADSFRILTVPVISANENLVFDSTHVILKDKSLIGTGELLMNGYPRVNFQYAMNGRDSLERKEYLENRIEKGSNKFLLDSWKSDSTADYLPQQKVFYTYRLDDYIQKADNELYVNLNLNRRLLEFKIKKDRIHDIEFENTLFSIDKVVIQCPDDYSILYIPESTSLEFDEFWCKIRYSIQNQSVIYEKEIQLKDKFIHKESFDEWSAFIAFLEKSYKQNVIFKQN